VSLACGLNRHSIPFVTCSAKTGAGIEFVNQLMIAMIYAARQIREPLLPVDQHDDGVTANSTGTNNKNRCHIQ
jgi:hypothetical protein